MKNLYKHQPKSPGELAISLNHHGSIFVVNLLVLLISVATLFTIYFCFGQTYNTALSNQLINSFKLQPVETLILKSPVKLNTVTIDNLDIKSVIDRYSADRIGIAIEDISTGVGKTYGSTDKFVAASTGKLIAAVAFYHKVEINKDSLSEQLGGHPASYQMEQMINRSNNDSWSLFQHHLGLDNLSSYATDIGIKYDGKNNTITPADMAKLLTKLYRGELLNKSHTKELLSYMQNTNYETLIPLMVPSGITVYHKYGLLNYVVHDVAILIKDNKAYALTIYTEGKDYSSMDDRVDAIHQITTATINQLFVDNK